MSKAQRSRERRMKLRLIREQLDKGIPHPEAHLVEKYREQKRRQSQRYRDKINSSLTSMDVDSEDYLKACDYHLREKIRHKNKYLASKEDWKDSFPWTNLELFD